MIKWRKDKKARKRCGNGKNSDKKETRHDERVEIEMWERKKRSTGEKKKYKRKKEVQEKKRSTGEKRN